MPDRSVHPGATSANLEAPTTPADAYSDISQLVTTRLRFYQSPVDTNEQAIAQHEGEIGRLEELVTTLEQAITASMLRLRLTTSPRDYEAVKHTCGDLQRFKLEIRAVQAEHQRAIVSLQAQEGDLAP